MTWEQHIQASNNCWPTEKSWFPSQSLTFCWPIQPNIRLQTLLLYNNITWLIDAQESYLLRPWDGFVQIIFFKFLSMSEADNTIRMRLFNGSPLAHVCCHVSPRILKKADTESKIPCIFHDIVSEHQAITFLWLYCIIYCFKNLNH